MEFKFASLSTLLLTGLAFAETSCPTLDQMTQCNLKGEWQPRNLSASVDCGPTIDGSFLYWNAKVDGYDFASEAKISGMFDEMGPTFLNAQLQPQTLDFDTWDPGFQVGLGYIFEGREQWHTRLSWTRFDTSNSKSMKATFSLANYFIPILIPSLIGPTADKVSAHWDLDFDVVDLELGRHFFVGKWLSLYPKLGLRAAWIGQDFNVDYHAIYPTNASLIFTFDHEFGADQHFKGIGLKCGSDIQFHLTKSFSILGNLSGSILSGKQHITENLNGVIFTTPSTFFPENVELKNSDDVIRTNLEGNIGLQYQAFFRDDQYRLGLSGLYSFAYWFTQNQLSNENLSNNDNIGFPFITMNSDGGDLQLQGLTVQLELDF